MNIEPGHTLYIGDNPINDYQGAIDAGLQAIRLDRASLHTDFAGFSVCDLTSLGIGFTVRIQGFSLEKGVLLEADLCTGDSAGIVLSRATAVFGMKFD